MTEPEFRVGGKQPGNLYRKNQRFGFVLRDEDGPLVAAALNAYTDGIRLRGEADAEDARRELGVNVFPSESAPQSTDEQRDLVEKWIHGCGVAYGVGGEEWSAFVASVANDVAAMLFTRDSKAAEYCRLYQSETDRVAELTRERDEALATIQAVLEMERTDRGFVRADDPETTRWMMGYDEALDEVQKVIAARRESGRPVAQEAGGQHPIDGRLTDADDYGQDYEAQAHALGLPEPDEDGAPRVARVWQKGDPEPAEVRLVVDRDGERWVRATDGWGLVALGRQAGLLPSMCGGLLGDRLHWSSEIAADRSLTEAIEGGDSNGD